MPAATRRRLLWLLSQLVERQVRPRLDQEQEGGHDRDAQPAEPRAPRGELARGEDPSLASGPLGRGVCPPVDPAAGARSSRVDPFAVRAGAAGPNPGLAPARILVIDDDLGKSGTSASGRAGFQRVVSGVSLDHVGIIFGIEMSRLARSNKDWQQLLDVNDHEM